MNIYTCIYTYIYIYTNTVSKMLLNCRPLNWYFLRDPSCRGKDRGAWGGGGYLREPRRKPS